MNKQIEAELRKSRRDARREVKLLLLGRWSVYVHLCNDFFCGTSCLTALGKTIPKFWGYNLYQIIFGSNNCSLNKFFLFFFFKYG